MSVQRARTHARVRAVVLATGRMRGAAHRPPPPAPRRPDLALLSVWKWIYSVWLVIEDKSFRVEHSLWCFL